ncbi:DUF7344 domain-containing protein [Natronococcus amylolyticus]|uniref:DUF7344 domain-containing protein n=1 Tax=Natronococcus amylolyticus TaxID=44470 RepID=UPI000677AD6B|nr:hypothetical protein [Natronococcus amylolyticus]
MSSDAQTSGDGAQGGLAAVSREWYDALRHPKRIHLLAALENGPHTLEELVDTIVAREPVERDEIRIELVHNHLPRLADHGIIEWDGETACRTVERSFPIADLSELLEGGDRVDGRTLETLVHPVRTQLYAMLAELDRAVSVETLAAELVERDIDSLSEGTEARLALYHVHLPAMTDVGAVEFDPRSGMVRGPNRSTPSTN